MRRIILLLYSFILVTLCANAHESDSIASYYEMDDFTVTGVKQGIDLYAEPISASVMSQDEVEQHRTHSIKEASTLAPNIYIPDYGSRMTSSIYVRGLGARIDNPVIGLNVDNVPYINKNAFDMDVQDISRIEMVRGPQSTLYGRNTMGGVINIYTLSPLSYQGMRASVEAGNGMSYKVRASYYDKVNERFGWSAGASYGSTGGVFENEHTGELLDWERNGSGRLKLQYHPNHRTQLMNTTTLNLTKQGGYPYKLVESGVIAYNDTSSYNRTSVTNGLTLNHNAAWGSIASITSYSYLDDAMRLDQDFTPLPYFTLTQATREHSVTEDLVFKLKERKGYTPLFGMYGMYKHQRMHAPVTFQDYGIEELILKNMNEEIAPYYYVWDDATFLLDSEFANAIAATALYHESSYTRGRWHTTASLRLAYEYNRLQYYSLAQSSATLYDAHDVEYKKKAIDIVRKGQSAISSVVLLPKVNVLYKLGKDRNSTLYFSVGMGNKAGGFNTQMFSDILQQDVMSAFGVGSVYDVDDVITYEPEYNWTFELGGHYENSGRSVMVDASLYYIACKNQQLTVFPEGQTTGRMMTNAGASRSVGGEVAMRWEVLEGWDVNASYGYTNARFTKYVSGLNDYKGKYVPYAPQHTLHVGTNYRLRIGKSHLLFDVNTNGVGKIYWNEENSQSQPYYMLLNASVSYEWKGLTVKAWGRNLTNTQYDVFYFKSIGREFVQAGRGTTWGVSVGINLEKRGE